MICLSCRQELVRETVMGIDIDRCRSCDGIWLDKGELMRLVTALSPLASNIDLQSLPKSARRPAYSSTRSCPRCGKALAEFNYSYNSNVMLDRCPGCKGIWLDGGELMRVLQFVKGHPKLDKMAAAIADNVTESMKPLLGRDEDDTSPVGDGLIYLGMGLLDRFRK